MAIKSGRNIEDCARLAEEAGLHTVICLFTDTWGIPRGKHVPLRQFLRGGRFTTAAVALSWNPRSDVLPTPWAETDSEYKDMAVVADLDTFRVAGWTEGAAVVICDTVDVETGEPTAMDARAMLKRTLREYADLGLTVNQAPELEFHLFDADWQRSSDKSFCYSLDRADQLEPVLGAIREALLRTGIDCEASNVEYGPSQAEVNLRHAPGLTAVDDAVLLRHLTRAVARRHGYNATFMVKPLNGGSGSGMHLHQSLADAEGRNAFAVRDAPGDGLPSKAMQGYVAGLLRRQLDLQVVAMPTVTAYRRAEDYSFAPTQVCWGLDNRLVGIRCLTPDEPGTRVEVRWGAADANPYLLAHGCLQAGLEGMRDNAPLQPVSSGDPHADGGLRRVAPSLEQAVETFHTSEFARRTYGDVFVDTYTVMQRNELAAFGAHVTDWEFSRYADVF
ncbi:glutamine synthetase family protein [Streptomyces sp. NPDC001941]|uniref:glutamine synthetase family protein n=1 Tax=Streptomyces sp. NPDC001941 TaxID=3154659 RepID=UPI00332C4F01